MNKYYFIYVALLIIGVINRRTHVNGTPLATPVECLGKDYCTVMPENYPQELIDRLFAKLDVQFPSHIMEEIRLENSEVNDIAGSNGCRNIRFISHIYEAKDQNGRNRIVVQSDKYNYNQMFRLHECIKPGETCFQDFMGPLCMTTKCVQNYRSYAILVLPLDPNESDNFDEITVRLPLGCFCRYKKFDMTGDICNHE